MTVHQTNCLIFVILFFFFQAEDGIRDVAVTGVQTCALPILSMDKIDSLRQLLVVMHDRRLGDTNRSLFADRLRSEERRVGKGVDLGGRRIIKKKKKRVKE